MTSTFFPLCPGLRAICFTGLSCALTLTSTRVGGREVEVSILTLVTSQGRNVGFARTLPLVVAPALLFNNASQETVAV